MQAGPLILVILCVATAMAVLALAPHNARPAKGCGYALPTQWAHGFETPLVRATRYSSPAIGYSIGFTFPENPDDCDRADMMHWLSRHGVRVYRCGGYSGAEVQAKVVGVSDRESADAWLMAFLPSLHQWVSLNLR